MLSHKVRSIAQREGAPDEIKQLDSALENINNISSEAKVVLVDTCLSHDELDCRTSLQTLVDIFGGMILVEYFATSRRHNITTSQRDELLAYNFVSDYVGLVDKFLTLIK